MKTKDFEEKLKIPDGIDVKIDDNIVTVSAKDKSLVRNLDHRKVILSVADKNILVKCDVVTKREKRIIGTFVAHMKNMFKGVTKGHVYKLKICSGHFPMNVSVSDNKFVVNNFLGEKTPREIILKKDADVKVEGDIVVVQGIDKELVSQTAASIEKLTSITNRDLRIFQDGIYIIDKDGKSIA